MDGTRTLAIVGAFALTGLFLVGCSNHVPQAKPTGRETAPAVSASIPAYTSTPAAPPPAATATPTKSPVLQPTAALSPTACPSSAPLDASDYYVINIDNSVSYKDSNNPIYTQKDEVGGNSYYPAGEEQYNDGKIHLGLVDGRGKVILPFEYYEINPLIYGTSDQAVGSRPTPFYFFARGYTFKKNTLSASDIGYLYNSRGKPAFREAYQWVSEIENKLIIGYRKAGAKSGAGAMTFSGKTVVPFTYENIVYLGKKLLAAVGGVGGNRRVDFYNFNGTLKGTLPIGRGDTFELSQVLVAKGANGRYGFIDSSMTWCCPPKWTDVDNEGFVDGFFMVFLGYDTLYVNRYGKTFIPKGYEEDYASACFGSGGNYATINGHILYHEYNDSGSILFNDAGKILFSSPDDIDYEDGVIITGGRAFDMNGKDLLPGVKDISQWLPDEKLFICKNSVYTSQGTKLPLPDAAGVEILSRDRFMITTADGKTGVCNGQGLWLVPPAKDYPKYNDFNESWPVYQGANGKYGFVDENGEIVTGPVYDDCWKLGDDFEVWCGPVHGLIDGQGNWLWYSTCYNVLLD